MPKLYEYLGIVVVFYSNEHEPILSTTKRSRESRHKDQAWISNLQG